MKLSLWEKIFIPVIILWHLILIFVALNRFSFWLDDSVQYVTIAENLRNFGSYSQCYLQPEIPDVQRTPGYPFSLYILGGVPLLVLFFQHLAVFWIARNLYLSARLFYSEQTARLTAYFWLLQPFTVHYASLMLAEIFAIAWLSYGVFKTLKFIRLRKVPDAVLSILAICIGAYFKPVLLVVIPVFLISGLLFLIFDNKWAYVIWLIIIPITTLLPWYLRNASVSGRFTFSTVGDISMFYGRLGAVEALKRGFPMDEHHAVLAGDLHIAESVGQPVFKQYVSDYQTHETELLSASANKESLRFLFKNPVQTLRLIVTAGLRMYQGVGYRTAEHITGSKLYAFVTSAIQASVLLLFAVSFLLYISNFLEAHFVHHWTFGIVLLLMLAGATAWADGRYRFMADLLLTLQVASLISRIWEYIFPDTADN